MQVQGGHMPIAKLLGCRKRTSLDTRTELFAATAHPDVGPGSLDGGRGHEPSATGTSALAGALV